MRITVRGQEMTQCTFVMMCINVKESFIKKFSSLLSNSRFYDSPVPRHMWDAWKRTTDFPLWRYLYLAPEPMILENIALFFFFVAHIILVSKYHPINSNIYRKQFFIIHDRSLWWLYAWPNISFSRSFS